MPAGQTLPDRVEYYYQAVSTGAEAGERLAHSRKCEMTQELNEQEEVEKGALRGCRPLASQAQCSAERAQCRSPCSAGRWECSTFT